MSRVFIGCSSYNTIPKRYYDEASKVANIFAKKGYDLAFGATTDGLMGVIYKEYLKFNNRKITAVCMKKWEDDLKKLGRVDETVLLDTTLEQLNYFMTCDKVVYLPGGYGTLTELIYLINAKSIKVCNSEIFIVNTSGFYDKIVEHFNKLLKEGFIKDASIFKEIKKIEDLEKLI